MEMRISIETNRIIFLLAGRELIVFIIGTKVFNIL